MTTLNKMSKRDALVLTQKVIGLANMGLMASERIVDEATSNMEQLQSAGECIAPDAIQALNALKMRALPGQTICSAAREQISVVLKPLQIQAREERRAQRETKTPVNIERPRG